MYSLIYVDWLQWWSHSPCWIIGEMIWVVGVWVAERYVYHGSHSPGSSWMLNVVSGARSVTAPKMHKRNDNSQSQLPPS